MEILKLILVDSKNLTNTRTGKCHDLHVRLNAAVEEISHEETRFVGEESQIHVKEEHVT